LVTLHKAFQLYAKKPYATLPFNGGVAHKVTIPPERMMPPIIEIEGIEEQGDCIVPQGEKGTDDADESEIEHGYFSC
jgi:hypothetical protein